MVEGRERGTIGRGRGVAEDDGRSSYMEGLPSCYHGREGYHRSVTSVSLPMDAGSSFMLFRLRLRDLNLMMRHRAEVSSDGTTNISRDSSDSDPSGMSSGPS